MADGMPGAADAVRLFRERFLNRTDTIAILAPWGKPCPVEGGARLDELLVAHVSVDAPEATASYENRGGAGVVRGRFRVGSYCPAPDSTTRWLCIDLDGAGHAGALADPEATALRTLDAFEAAGILAYLERSGGGSGWHVWSFFDPPIPAQLAQSLGRALAPTGAPLADGGVADPRAARGIEVFPKQPKIGGAGFGNLVWLPWWQGAPAGANLFYRRVAGGLEPYAPTEFITATAAAVEAALAPAAKSESWDEWRRRALEALPLERIYGAWLTGRSNGPGWLECRDPASATGDKNPSAGVADGTGQAERGAFHSFISGKTLSVFDFLIQHGGAADFRAARATVAELSGVPEPPTAKRGQEPPRPERPRIQVNGRQLRDIVADTWRAARAATDHAIYVRSGALIRLARSGDVPRIEPMDEAAVYGYLARIADWVRITEHAVVDTSPVKDVARDLLAYPHAALPVLEAVVSTPVFDAGGALVSTPGYHTEARLWFHQPAGFEVPRVPDRPSSADVAAARALLLDDLLVDFPFAAESDRAHALAALVLPFARRMIAGCTPIHLVEAPTPGSGKGLLGDLVALVADGRVCEPTTITQDEDEARKKITSLLAKAQTVILLDNVRDGIDSAQLASALTAETWSDRLLGQTRMIDLPNRATWIVTANNPRLSLEIARRCVRVRLDAKTDRPWARTGFKHSPLRDWARRQRARLVHALLVLIQAWIAAGQPPGPRTLGSFESWANVVGGIFAHAEIAGFLEHTDALYEAADTEGQEWREFVAAWWEKHGGAWVSATDLLKLATDGELLGSVVGEKSARSQKIRLGKALATARDRHFASFRIVAGRNLNTKAAQYRLAMEGDAEPARGTQLELVTGDCGMCGMSEEHIPHDIPQGKASE